jgi:hypothetical protein
MIVTSTVWPAATVARTVLVCRIPKPELGETTIAYAPGDTWMLNRPFASVVALATIVPVGVCPGVTVVAAVMAMMFTVLLGTGRGAQAAGDPAGSAPQVGPAITTPLMTPWLAPVPPLLTPQAVRSAQTTMIAGNPSQARRDVTCDIRNLQASVVWFEALVVSPRFFLPDVGTREMVPATRVTRYIRRDVTQHLTNNRTPVYFLRSCAAASFCPKDVQTGDMGDTPPTRGMADVVEVADVSGKE